jgi:hypothetical protein
MGPIPALVHIGQEINVYSVLYSPFIKAAARANKLSSNHRVPLVEEMLVPLQLADLPGKVFRTHVVNVVASLVLLEESWIG